MLRAVPELPLHGVVDERQPSVGVERVHRIVDGSEDGLVPLQPDDPATAFDLGADPPGDERDELPLRRAERRRPRLFHREVHRAVDPVVRLHGRRDVRAHLVGRRVGVVFGVAHVGERQRPGPVVGERRRTHRLAEIVHRARLVGSGQVERGLDLVVVGVGVDVREDPRLEAQILTAERQQPLDGLAERLGAGPGLVRRGVRGRGLPDQARRPLRLRCPRPRPRPPIVGPDQRRLETRTDRLDGGDPFTVELVGVGHTQTQNPTAADGNERLRPERLPRIVVHRRLGHLVGRRPVGSPDRPLGDRSSRPVRVARRSAQRRGRRFERRDGVGVRIVLVDAHDRPDERRLGQLDRVGDGGLDRVGPTEPRRPGEEIARGPAGRSGITHGHLSRRGRTTASIGSDRT